MRNLREIFNLEQSPTKYINRRCSFMKLSDLDFLACAF